MVDDDEDDEENVPPDDEEHLVSTREINMGYAPTIWENFRKKFVVI